MKLGFIGCGNMASAVMGGILKKGLAKPEEIMGSNPHQPALDKVKNSFGIQVTLDNKEAVSWGEIVFLGMKPQQAENAVPGVAEVLTRDQLLISMVTGKTVDWLENQLGSDKKIIRIMPNTPALVGEGMTAVIPNKNVSEGELDMAMQLFSSFGKAQVIPEHLLNAEMAAASCSPAYVFMMIEAMADGAVAGGIPRSQAMEFAAQAVLGSAKMVLETGKHPGELKDMVCSPAGTTIEAVRVLEENGFRAALMDAMKACIKRAEEL